MPPVNGSINRQEGATERIIEESKEKRQVYSNHVEKHLAPHFKILIAASEKITLLSFQRRVFA